MKRTRILEVVCCCIRIHNIAKARQKWRPTDYLLSYLDYDAVQTGTWISIFGCSYCLQPPLTRLHDVVYLTTLSIGQTIQRRKWIMNWKGRAIKQLVIWNTSAFVWGDWGKTMKVGNWAEIWARDPICSGTAKHPVSWIVSRTRGPQ
jgi:hypothetical protein